MKVRTGRVSGQVNVTEELTLSDLLPVLHNGTYVTESLCLPIGVVHTTPITTELVGDTSLTGVRGLGSGPIVYTARDHV